MKSTLSRAIMFRTASLFVAISFFASASAAPPNYQDHVLPILKKHCLNCHNADEAEADLDLSTLKTLQAGSSGGKVLVAGSPSKSSLFLAVNHDESVAAMPPESPKIPAAQIKLMSDWIAGGLLASAGAKSQLRDVSFAVSVGSMKRPDKPAFPTNLPKQPSVKTNTPPPVVALATSPWANVVAASGHRQVVLYGAAAEEEGAGWNLLGALPFPDGDIHDIRFSRNGELLVVAGGIGAQSGKVAVFDVATGKRIATLADEYDVVLSADISSDHQFVAIGTPKRMVKIFSTKDGSLLHRIKKHTDWVTVVRFSPDGKQLASADRNGGIHVWETGSGGIVYTLDEHKVKINALSWRGDGKYLASGAEDGTFVLWDMKDGWATRSVNAHIEKSETRYSRHTGVLDIDFAANGHILTTGRDRKIRLWKSDGGGKMRSEAIGSLPLNAEFVGGSTSAIVATMDGTITRWDLTKMKVLDQLAE